MHSAGRSNGRKSIPTGNIGSGTGTLLVGDARLPLLIRSDKRGRKGRGTESIVRDTATVGR